MVIAVKYPGILLILPAILAVALVGAAEAGEENGLPGVLWERLISPDDAFLPSLRFRLEYDDNINLTGRSEQRGSWKNVLEPGLKFNFPGEQTGLEFQYFPTFFLYWDRDDRYDINHTAFIQVEHSFDSRNKIRIANLFFRKEDPRDLTRVIVPGQRLADYYYNNLILKYRNQPNRRITWGVNYDNERYSYDAEVMKRSLNMTANDVGGVFQFQCSRRFKLKGVYQFRLVDYDQSDGDYRRHLFLGGFNWLANRRLTFDVLAGYTNQRLDSGVKLAGPYIETMIEAIVGPDLFIEVSYTHSIEDLPESYQPRRLGHTLEISAAYDLLPRLRLGSKYLGRLTYYPYRRSTEDERKTGSELFWQSELYSEYCLNPATSLKLGWRRTENSSNQPGSTFFRDQVYLAVTADF